MQAPPKWPGIYFSDLTPVKKWNKTENPEKNPCTYGHLIFDKRGKDIQ